MIILGDFQEFVVINDESVCITLVKNWWSREASFQIHQIVLRLSLIWEWLPKCWRYRRVHGASGSAPLYSGFPTGLITVTTTLKVLWAGQVTRSHQTFSWSRIFYIFLVVYNAFLSFSAEWMRSRQPAWVLGWAMRRTMFGLACCPGPFLSPLLSLPKTRVCWCYCNFTFDYFLLHAQ